MARKTENVLDFQLKSRALILIILQIVDYQVTFCFLRQFAVFITEIKHIRAP